MTELRLIVAYDVSDDRRRNRLFKLLGSFGVNTQYSFFEMDITRKQFVRLRSEIRKILNLKEDRIAFIFLCERCWDKVERWGYDMPMSLGETIII